MPATAASPPSAAPTPSPPVYTELAKVYTVRDAWREWREGLAGRPAVRELEEAWGSRWRPGNAVRVQFCRRKVLWDEVMARVAHNKTKEGLLQSSSYYVLAAALTSSLTSSSTGASAGQG